MTVRELEVHALYGLTVASEVPLHQSRAVQPSGEPDLVIRWGEPIPRRSTPPEGRVLAHLETDQPYYTFTVTESGEYVLRFYRVCDFVVAPSMRRVWMHVVDGADAGVAGVLAAGALLSFVLTMRRQLVLHASAVQVGDSAVAFVGRSGMGKSTMAGLMCADGATLITDDVLRLDHDGAGYRCRLGATELRLRKAAAELIEKFPVAPASRVTSDARDAVRLESAQRDDVPLSAVIVPVPDRERTKVEVTRLRPMDALITVLCFPRLLGWTDRAVLDRQFHDTAGLVETVPVLQAYVPWGPPFADGIAAAVVDEAFGVRAAPVVR